jgi:transcriptional regulator with XRE-family HTH domain
LNIALEERLGEDDENSIYLKKSWLKELSFTATMFSGIETGTRNPSLKNIEKLAKALDISVARLFSDYGVEVESESEI